MESKSYLNGNVEYLKIGSEKARAVDAYINYYNIVGDDDGGKMMTDAEFEAYKKKVAYARANHLYVFYVNAKGQECKAIGPSSMCFCRHRFRNHNFDNIKSKNVSCKNCKCKLFNYIPVHGSLDIKCGCHHSYEDHDPVSKKCLKCNVCKKFTSNYTCDCGMPYDMHHTQIETRQERMKLGKAVDSGNNLAAGIGGLGSFGSMVGAMYQEHYKDLLEGDGMKSLPQQKKNYLGDGSDEYGYSGYEGKGSGNKGSSGVLDLFNQPNKFGGGGMSYGSGVKGLNSKMGKMNIGGKKGY